jgi:predicted extracellular nuclease
VKPARFRLGTFVALAFFCVLVGAAPTGASPSGLVISQIYGGGGNAGATLKNDFIEVFNAGSGTADLTGWSVQYASAAGTTWQTTNLSGTLASGQYLLVQEAAGAGGTVDLPPADVTGSINMSATAGKVALVNGTTALTGSCPPGVADLVGYGTTANCFEGFAPTGALQNTTAALRLRDGCTDTNSNSFDFVTGGGPNPRNRLSPLHDCTGGDDAPTITAVTPVGGTTGFAVDGNITVTFSEPVDVSAGWFLIVCLTSGSHTATVTGGPTTFTLDPDANFASAEQCSVGINGDHISDQDSNDPPDTLPGNPSWSFTTGVAAVPLVVVSQVYGGGGNSGAAYKNDFIELYNRGSGPVSLNGWSVQYASAAGTTWLVTDLTDFSLQPGQHYLVQEALGAGGTLNLPPPDATGTTAMSATAGKVALVSSTTALSGACPTGGSIMDFVGYGTTANCFEGSGPTAAPSNTTAALRKGAGATDTNDNAADFEIAAPNPRNSGGTTGDDAPSVTSRAPGNGAVDVAVSSNITIGFSEPVNVSGTWYSISCTTTGVHTATVSGGPTTFTLDPDSDFVSAETCTVTVFAASVTDQDTNDPPDTMASDDTWSFATVAPPVAIHDIQGAAHRSPLDGQNVANVNGIATAKRSNGFYMQDPDPDADDATSEGIFVFTSSAPSSVNVGDAVKVNGHVQEFRPGGLTSTNLTTTELSSPTINVLSSGNPLPAATVVGTGGRVPPSSVIEDDATGDVETSGTFDPDSDGLDFWEALEGMRVQFNDAVAVGPTNPFGETPVVGDDGANASLRTARGGLLLRPADANPERLILDDSIVAPQAANVGDHYPGATLGVLDYNFGNFMLEVTSVSPVVHDGVAPESTTAAGAGQVSIGTFNFENLDPTDPQSKFDRLAGILVHNLASPDILSGEEVQDNNGPTNDGVVAADQTLAQLIAAIQAAGGPTYDWRAIDPVNNQDGGEPGGNIRQVFLFRTDRVTFVDRPGGGSTTATTVVNTASGPQLSASPGRIDPTNSAFNASRKPLAGEFLFNGRHLFVIANHFNSKGGDQPLMGHFQPPARSSETQRHAQAQIVHDFVASILGYDSNASVVVDGDLNDFEFSDTVSILKNGILNDLIDTLPQNERYSYVFEGNSQTLDHILVTNALFGEPFTYDVVHVNSEFADQASDHDPSVVHVMINAPPSVSAGGPYSVAEGGSVGLMATGSDPEGGALQYAWDLDDNGSFETPGQNVTFSAATLDGPSTHTVKVRVTDAGGLTAVGATTVDVTNVAPMAIFTAPASTFAGSPFTLSLSSPSDPSAADVAAGFEYAFDCGDGSGYSAFGSSPTRSCPTTDVGTRSVGARIRDKDGGVRTYPATVQVIVTYASLCDLVHRLVTDPTIAAALCDKLDAAEAAAARGNNGTKQNQLQSFRNQVDAQTGKSISAADAELLKRLSTQL